MLKTDSQMKVRYSYLAQQFADPEEILEQIRSLTKIGDYTLGSEVERFEGRFAELIGVNHAIGVNSGTDALTLSLRALGIGNGDEVITAANTFIATVGAINAVGATPVLVDVTPYFTLDPERIKAAISPRTKAIIPVHLTGEVADMEPILEIADRHGLEIVEDACQAINATVDGKPAGTIGATGAFSLHPLKNLNVWGDAGVIVTNSEELATTLRLLRNHGLKSRDEVEILGFNSRLDTLQAIVGNWLIDSTQSMTDSRRENAAFYDKAWEDLSDFITIPPRRSNVRRVFHIYMVNAQNRDSLYSYLHQRGVEAKIHYPIPLHLQKAVAHLGYKGGDFPETERQSANVISLPADQHLSQEQLDYVVDAVKSFYLEQ